MFQRMISRIGVACAALGLGGCYACAETPVVHAEAQEAPVEIEIQTYPQTQDEGRPVYLYRDRWYYQDGSRWQYSGCSSALRAGWSRADPEIRTGVGPDPACDHTC
ncbi:MAG: hypothetical protein ABI134_11350 [Byssovorax sp.]